MGLMIRGKHHNIDKVYKTLAQNTYFTNGRLPGNRYTAAVLLCHFFKVTFMLPD